MDGMRQGLTNEEIFDLCAIDPWFLTKFREIYNIEASMTESILSDEEAMRTAKTNGFSDVMIARLISKTEEDVYAARKTLDVNLEYNEVDTCAAEFKALNSISLFNYKYYKLTKSTKA